MAKYCFATAFCCLLLALSVAAGSFLVAPPSATAQYYNPYQWSQVTSLLPTDVDLTSVFMTDDYHAWITARTPDHEGIIYLIRWNGEKWFIEDDETIATPLNAVVAVSDEKVWAAGDDSLIIKGGLSGWGVDNPNESYGAVFTTIQMFGEGEEGWTGGYVPSNTPGSQSQPILLHYRNGQWQRDTTITGFGGINALHFTHDGGWAVGSSVWHYHNGKWTEEQMPPFCPSSACRGTLYNVRAISADEAWSIGTRTDTFCGICFPAAYALHRTEKGWERVLPDNNIGGLQEPNVATKLKGIAGNSYPYNPDLDYLLAAGEITDRTGPGNGPKPLIAYFSKGAWYNQSAPDIQGSLNAISSRSANSSIAVGDKGLILVYGYAAPPVTATPVPGSGTGAPPAVARVADPRDPNIRYFPEVGHTLRGGFQTYWLQHGGLQQFGFPLTEEYQHSPEAGGPSYTTQWFERARFEWHPENRPPYDVLLGLLGREVTKSITGEPAFLAVPPPQAPGSPVYFPQTGHTLAPQFTAYWQSQGGLPVYGYPISEPFMETSKTDGKLYLVQYFERNRLEYHSELPATYRVSLGLLGVDILRSQEWIP